MNDVKGFSYHQNVAPDPLREEVKAWIQQQNFRETGYEKYKSRRKVLHYGYKYDYDKRTAEPIDDQIPEILIRLRDTIPVDDPTIFNQCIINRYLPTERITKHIDAKCFGGTIACFSFGDPATMRFTLLGEKRDAVVEDNSVYIMTKDARYVWSHEMINSYTTSTKSTKSTKNGFSKQRKNVRYSITFRSV